MGQIYVKSRHSKIAPQDGCIILDLTSKSGYPWVKFSPFFPHEDIPIPWSKKTSQSVEGIWQGLKVFTNEGVDESYFLKTDMKNMKRGGSKRGTIIGHQRGLETSHIKSKEQFIAFLNQLSNDLLENPNNWANLSLSDFLIAMQSWTEDMEGYYENLKITDSDTANGSWRIFADILIAAKNYE